MSEPMTWEMPAPPPAHVLTVVDDYGVELRRCGPSGLFWRDYGDEPDMSWNHVVYHRGPITAGELAA
jgi:hypothetical protein